MKKHLIALIALVTITASATSVKAADFTAPQHYGFGIEFLQCMAKAKFFPLVAPVCVVIAGVDAMINPPEKTNPEYQVAKNQAPTPRPKASLSTGSDLKLVDSITEPAISEETETAPIP